MTTRTTVRKRANTVTYSTRPADAATDSIAWPAASSHGATSTMRATEGKKEQRDATSKERQGDRATHEEDNEIHRNTLRNVRTSSMQEAKRVTINARASVTAEANSIHHRARFRRSIVSSTTTRANPKRSTPIMPSSPGEIALGETASTTTGCAPGATVASHPGTGVAGLDMGYWRTGRRAVIALYLMRACPPLVSRRSVYWTCTTERG